ncbi:MAG: penicillin acylase family protein [Pirellulaceae bacterium]|nr:penicillin acylase family protein [Pirellulaceae bacterium]
MFRSLHFMARALIGWLVLVPSMAVLATGLEEYSPPANGSVRVTRDRYGVPHIVARDMRSLFYGAGYCQAEDQIENIALNMLRGQGRSAEYDGLSALPLDHLVRCLDLPGRAVEHYKLLTDNDKLILDAFAAGINDYLAAHRETTADWIQPVTAEQVLAFSDYVDVIFTARNCQEDLAKAGIRLADMQKLPEHEPTLLGSNQFAVAPSRSASRSAILSMDPHLPHTGFFRWYEMHLVGPDINVMGACFYGLPTIGMGRTARSAWCMTVNGPDLGDVFSFQRDPSDPALLKTTKGWERFDIVQEVYRVKTPLGVTEMKLPRQSSPVGPVMVSKDNVAYAFAVPLSDSPDRSAQMMAMAQAKNVAEFRKSLEPLGLVMFNILYADVDGDIFIISNSRLPKRDLRIDSHSIRPGDEQWARWQGYHRTAELPQVLNPPCGYLLNTNSGPQNVTEAVAPRPEDFPPYFMSQQMNSRCRRLTDLLSADKSISWDEVQTYATDTHLIGADTLVPKIIAAIDEGAAQLADQREILEQVRTVLNAWDRRTDVESRGAVLFSSIVRRRDFQTGNSQSDQAAIVGAVVKAAADVQTTFGRLDCPWGDFSRIRRGDVELGVAGNGVREAALDRLGLTALRPTGGDIKEGRRYCQVGTSYAMVVDFSGATRSISILPYGVSENPQSPHFADQLPLYAETKYKPAWFLPEEIRQNAESEVVLTAK